LLVPESIRWLLSRGRNADARREAAKLLGVPENSISLPKAVETTRNASIRELLKDQKRFWWVAVIWIGISTGTYGVILWGPTILSQLLKISAHEAAHYFVYASIFSLLGRVLFSVLPLYIGRRGAAIVGTACSVVIMLAIFTFYREFVAGWSVFALLVIFGANVLQRPVLQHVALCGRGVPGFAGRPRLPTGAGFQRRRQDFGTGMPRADRGQRRHRLAEGHHRRDRAGVPVPRRLRTGGADRDRRLPAGAARQADGYRLIETEPTRRIRKCSTFPF
jgi:hypothetical protein